MEQIKKYAFRALKVFIGLFLYMMSICLLNYTGLLKLSTISKINYFIIALMFLLEGIKMGKKASKKGFLEGLKLGGITIFVLLILNLIFYRNFNLYCLMYYVLILASSTIGAMIGINLHR